MGRLGELRLTSARRPALDGVRGLAILFVLALHFTHAVSAQSVMEAVLQSITQIGLAGVDLFFVLSGYLITGVLLDAKGRAHYFRDFYIRRALRIFPLYYSALLFVGVILPALTTFRPSYMQSMLDNQAWAWLYLTNLYEAQGRYFYMFGPLWSLAVEEHFYLVWPALVWALTARSLKLACVAIMLAAPILRLLLALSGHDGEVAYVLTPTRIDSLAAGALVVLLAREASVAANLRRYAGSIAALSAFGLLAIWARRHSFDRVNDPVFAVIGYSLLAALFGVLIAKLTAKESGRRTPIRRFFEAKWLRFFGKYSYGLYVVHWPLLIFATEWWGLPDRLTASLPYRSVAMLLFYGLMLTLSVGTAYLSYHALEKRFLVMKEHFAQPPMRAG